MNTATRSRPTDLDLVYDGVGPHRGGVEEPVDALATKVFASTLVYIVVFVTATVLLVA